MALTMTRTRTQTALTKLVELVANLNGELAFVQSLLKDPNKQNEHERLILRRAKLVSDLHALYLTVRQFDPEIDPSFIGVLETWRKQYGRKLGAEALVKRYLQADRP